MWGGQPWTTSLLLRVAYAQMQSAHRAALSFIRTTFDVQLHGQIDLWFGVHLTLVYTGVPFLHKLYLQVPLFAVFRMDDPESPVAGVRVNAGRQYVQVSFPHPRHLQMETVVVSVPVFPPGEYTGVSGARVGRNVDGGKSPRRRLRPVVRGSS